MIHFQMDWCFREEFPDGSDESQYKHFRQMDNRSIAWEYLRRNPTYQAKWDALYEMWAAGNPDPGGVFKLSEDFNLVSGCAPNPYKASPPAFNVERLANYPQLLTIWDGDGGESPRGDYEHVVGPLIDVRLSLLAPFDQQAAQQEVFYQKARAYLGLDKALRKPTEKRPDMHILYCRVLDARVAGATTDAEIAERLGLSGPDDARRVYDWRKAAERLRDGDYEQIAMLSLWREPRSMQRADQEALRRYRRQPFRWKKVKL